MALKTVPVPVVTLPQGKRGPANLTIESAVVRIITGIGDKSKSGMINRV